MAVISYREACGEWHGPRNFHPPKRADLRHWWKAAKKMLPILPEWHESFRALAIIDEGSIIWELSEGAIFISRKAHL